MSGHILVVDDEQRIREVVEYALDQVGFRVSSACGGVDALERLENDKSDPFDLVILDVLMPDLDGLEVCRRLRARSSTPVIFLSSRGEETDRIVGLELGGDDYVTKPFSPRELLARVRSVLRRTNDRRAREVLFHGALRVDVRRHTLEYEGESVNVTATEFGLLVAILAAEGEVLTRRQLIDRAYQGSHHVSERTIDTHIKRLRRKLARYEIDPIATVNGVGYRAA